MLSEFDIPTLALEKIVFPLVPFSSADQRRSAAQMREKSGMHGFAAQSPSAEPSSADPSSGRRDRRVLPGSDGSALRGLFSSGGP